MRRNSYKGSRARVIGLVGEGKKKRDGREKNVNLCEGLGNNFRINLGNLFVVYLCSKDEKAQQISHLYLEHTFSFHTLALIL